MKNPFSRLALSSAFFALALFAAPLWAAPGDTLQAAEDGITLYIQPDPASRAVATLKKGESLLERERQGPWLYVISTDQGEAGWMKAKDAVAPPSAGKGKTVDAFKLFMEDFAPMNEGLAAYLGESPFAGAKDLGQGALQITANDKWIAEGRHHPNSSLLFRKWKQANRACTCTLSIVDKEGVERFFMRDGPDSPIFTERAIKPKN